MSDDIYRIEKKGSNYLIHREEDEKPIKIPSQLFPLTGPAHLICSQNTAPFEDSAQAERIREIFDSISPRVGYCYDNTRRLVDALHAAGIAATSFVGWELVGGSLPVHHCFAMVDDHILDYNIRPEEWLSEEYLSAEIGNVRAKMANDIARLMREKRPSEVMGFGQASSYCAYIATPCSPATGLAKYRALMKAFPKHPSYQNIRPSGINHTQELIYKELGESPFRE